MISGRKFAWCLVLLVGCTDAATRKIDEGNRLAKAGKLDDAAKSFETAATLGHPVRAQVLLGNVRWAQGRRADARAAYASALDAGPSEADALVGYAKSQLADGDAKGAALSATTVLTQTPGRADARLVRAAARLASQQDLDAALEDADAALSAAGPPGDSDALYVKGCVLIALKRYADAQAAFSSLEQRHPRSPLSAYGQARLAAAQNHKTDLKAYLFDAKNELGEGFDPARVALDPAFDFVRDDPDLSFPGRDGGP